MRTISLVAGIVLLVAATAHATFFKYKDSNGNIVITDKLENVPQKYRNKCKAIFDEELDAKDSLKRRWAASDEARKRREQEEQKHKAIEKKKSGDGKQLVITVDERTGEIIRTME